MCDRRDCNQEAIATITLSGTANARCGPGEKKYYLCSQHYCDTKHVIKSLQLLVNLPIETYETVNTAETRDTDDGQN